MSDSEDVPTKGPPPNETTDTEAQETDPQPQKSRSRSQSRRARRQKQQSQTQKQKQKQKEMPPVEEALSEEEDAPPPQAQAGAMQPFEHIGKDSTSMDGPVTYARAQRGEIPMRPGNPNQSLKTGNPNHPPPEDFGQQAMQPKEAGGGESDLMKQEGLKLRIELNLDIEIELKAKIYGDLTLALLA